jgi:hypothetical protein
VKPASRRAVLLLAAFPALAAASGRAQEAMKSGLWQFTSQNETAASAAGFSPPSQAQQGGSTFTNCIDPTRSVPTDPHLGCKVESVNRSGATVTWAMTCTVPQGTFRSQAVAQYSGSTMTGTMTTFVPMIGGQMSQRISGRYLGPCTR